jgi:hypothetical protein
MRANLFLPPGLLFHYIDIKRAVFAGRLPDMLNLPHSARLGYRGTVNRNPSGS